MLLVMLKYYEENKETITSLLCMFIIELIILVGFNLANQHVIYRILGFLIMCALLPLVFKRYNKKVYSLLAVSISALILFIVPSILSPLTSKVGILEQIGILLGIIPFFIFGVFFALTNVKKKMITYLLLAIYGSLSVFALVSLIITIIDFSSPFYYLIYSKNDQLVEIINYADALIGFSTHKVRIESLSNIGLVCATSLSLAVICDKKKDKKVFYISTLCGLIGVITVVFLATPLNMYALCAFFIVLIGFKNWGKPSFNKRAYFITILISLLAIISLRITYHLVPSFKVFLDKTYVLKEIIVPRIGLTERLNAIKYSFENISLLGQTNYQPTGIMIFDVLQLDGVFAFIGLTVFFIVAIYGIYRFIKKSDSSLKFGIASLSVSLLFIFLLNDYRILTVFSTRPIITKYYYPTSLDILFALFLPLVGYYLFYRQDEKVTMVESK